MDWFLEEAASRSGGEAGGDDDLELKRGLLVEIQTKILILKGPELVKLDLLRAASGTIRLQQSLRRSRMWSFIAGR